jgi:hypothetical protein
MYQDTVDDPSRPGMVKLTDNGFNFSRDMTAQKCWWMQSNFTMTINPISVLAHRSRDQRLKRIPNLSSHLRVKKRNVISIKRLGFRA